MKINVAQTDNITSDQILGQSLFKGNIGMEKSLINIYTCSFLCLEHVSPRFLIILAQLKGHLFREVFPDHSG